MRTAAALLAALSLSLASEPTEHFSKSDTGMVASGSTHATAAGVRMLEQGGNAVDAAAAAAFAIMVTDPANSSIGGRVQALARLKDGRILGIDGATQVPRDFQSRRDQSRARAGWRVVPVPGAPAALEEMARLYGRKTLAEILAPAIKLAEGGFPVPPRLARTWSSLQKPLSQDPGAGMHFLKADGSTYRSGEIFRQPRLAALLREMASKGTGILYRGAKAERIARDAAANGGYLRAVDLAAYHVEPARLARTRYRDYEVVTAGARAWGSTLQEMLKALHRTRIGPGEPTADGLEAIARAVAQALADRPRDGAGQTHDTTHISVMDVEGNAVALTTSIGPSFGSRVASPALGFLYAHSYRMQSGEAPGERDMTEMSPSMVLDPGKPFLVIGGAGSERIPSAVMQVISNLVDRHMTLEPAVRAPRVFLTKEKLDCTKGLRPPSFSPWRRADFRSRSWNRARRCTWG